METFYWLRQIPGIQKKPSTSELIDWLRALAIGGIEPEEISNRLPFLGVVLKKDKDVEAAAFAARHPGAVRPLLRS